MKTCCRCKKEKSTDEFHVRKANKDGRQGYCKECAKVHYQKWSEQSPERKQRHGVWKKARVQETRTKFYEFLSTQSCIDCGISDWRVLEFDHISDDKVAGVAYLVGNGATWEKILEEIEKCEVRCCNCHRIITGERGGWWTANNVRD